MIRFLTSWYRTEEVFSYWNFLRSLSQPQRLRFPAAFGAEILPI